MSIMSMASTMIVLRFQDRSSKMELAIHTADPGQLLLPYTCCRINWRSLRLQLSTSFPEMWYISLICPNFLFWVFVYKTFHFLHTYVYTNTYIRNLYCRLFLRLLRILYHWCVITKTPKILIILYTVNSFWFELLEVFFGQFLHHI